MIEGCSQNNAFLSEMNDSKQLQNPKEDEAIDNRSICFFDSQ